MRFRSPTETTIRVALTSGHVAMIGPEWRELPELFQYHAVRLGCERDDRELLPPKKQVEADPAAGSKVNDYDTAYRNALITMLGREEPGDFTRDNLPNTNAVSKLVGFTATKLDVLRVFQMLKDETATPVEASAGEAKDA